MKKTLISSLQRYNSTKFFKNDFLFTKLNKMQNVSTFKDICLRQNSLILCDIDDTVLDYGKEIDDYWKQKIDDPNYNIWISIIKRTTPKLTDLYLYEFIKNINNSNSIIHFITHRNVMFKEITKEHMNYYNLNNIEIHYLNGNSKSKYINENFNTKDFEGGAVFIDDSYHNINDVLSNVSNCDVYLFKKIT